MGDYNNSYLNYRRAKNLSGGPDPDIAKSLRFAETKIEPTANGGYVKIGRNPEDGVAMNIQNYGADALVVDLQGTGPIFLDGAEAQEKARLTGMGQPRIDSGHWVAQDQSGQAMLLGRVRPGGEHIDAGQIQEAGGTGGVPEDTLGQGLADTATTIDAPVAGLARGVVKAGANTLAAIGILDQDKVDQFFQMLEGMSEAATEDNPVASIADAAGEITGQYVLPAGGAYKVLTALGASPLAASVIAETGAGLFGVSPNEENIFNMIDGDSDTAQAVRDLIATDPSDPEWVNRARNASEALLLLGAGETAIRGLISGVRKAGEIARSPVGQEIGNLFRRFAEDEGLDVGNVVGESDVTKLAALGAVPVGTGAMIPGSESEFFDDDKNFQTASASSRFLREIIKVRETLRKPTTALDKVSKETDLANELLNIRDREYAGFIDTDPVEGIDFNFNNIESSDDLKNGINEVSRIYESSIDAAKKGVIPLEVTEQVATLLGTEPGKVESIVKNLPADVEDLHVRALLMRRALVDTAAEADRLARVVVDGGPNVSDGDYLRFRESIARYSQMVKNMKGVQTEIARALSAFRIPAGQSPVRDSQFVSEILDDLGGRGAAMELADKWLRTPLSDRAEYANRTAFQKSKDVMFEIWINGILSSFRTHEVNVLGNLLFGYVAQPVERFGAATIGALSRDPDRVRFREVLSMLKGQVYGTVDGVRMASQAWKNELPNDAVAKVESYNQKAITSDSFNFDPNSLAGRGVDYIGQAIRLPTRALMVEDEYFKAIGYRQQLHAITTRKLLAAIDDGTLGETIIRYNDRVSESDFPALTKLRKSFDANGGLNRKELRELEAIMLNNPTDEISVEAQDFARMVTFQTELGAATQSVQRAVRTVPGARLVIPFIRTPTNILKEFARRSPVAAAMPSVYADFAAGGARRDLAMSRIAIGTSLMTWAAFLAADGVITGAGPDPSHPNYASWRATHEPYSMKLDGKWYPYGRIEPLANLFGSVANAADYIAYSDDEAGILDVTMSVAIGVIQQMGDKTYLRGISDFANAYSDPKRFATEYTLNITSGLIPYSAMLRDVTRATDPVVRDRRLSKAEKELGFVDRSVLTITNELKSRTPGLSSELPARMSFWGEDLYGYDGPAIQAFNAFRTRKLKNSPIDDELVRLRVPFDMPRQAIGNVGLTHNQYRRLIKLMNSTPAQLGSTKLITAVGGNHSMRTFMNNLVQSPIYKGFDFDEERKTYLVSVKNTYLEAAKEALAREEPDLAIALIEERMSRQATKLRLDAFKQVAPIGGSIEPPSGTGAPTVPR